MSNRREPAVFSGRCRITWWLAAFSVAIATRPQYAPSQTSQPLAPQDFPEAQISVPNDVRFAIERCEQSYRAVSNVAYSFNEVSESKSDKTEVDGSAKQSATLDSEQLDVEQTQLIPPGDPHPMHVLGYITDHELGAWIGASGPHNRPVQYTYRSRDTMSDAASSVANRCAAPHPEISAFGTGVSRTFLWDPSNFGSDATLSWKMEKVAQNGRSLLQLTQKYSPPFKPDKVILTNTYLLDPEQGYAVVKATAARRGIKIIRESDVELKDWTGHGTWYPKKIVFRYFQPGIISDGSPTITSTLVITNLSVNPSFAKPDFTLYALHMPKGREFSRVDAEGRPENLVWKGYVAATTQASGSDRVPSDGVDTTGDQSARAAATVSGNRPIFGESLAFCGALLVVAALVAGHLRNRN